MDYCTVEQLREMLSDAGSSLPASLLQRAVTAASRAVDVWCNVPAGSFAPSSAPAPRLFRACDSTLLEVDPFGALDGLAVELDADGDGVFETSLSASDVVPEPLNADSAGDAFAWTALAVADPYSWPVGGVRPGVRVTARWGYSAVPADVEQATLIRAAALFKRKESPHGVAEFGEFGPVRISRNDPDVMALLERYRRWTVV